MVSRFTLQEQSDLFTPGYKAWCERRWQETLFLPYVDAYMECLLVRYLESLQPRRRRRGTAAA